MVETWEYMYGNLRGIYKGSAEYSNAVFFGQGDNNELPKSYNLVLNILTKLLTLRSCGYISASGFCGKFTMEALFFFFWLNYCLKRIEWMSY